MCECTDPSRGKQTGPIHNMLRPWGDAIEQEHRDMLIFRSNEFPSAFIAIHVRVQEDV